MFWSCQVKLLKSQLDHTMTDISNFISQSNTRIENTVKSAVKQLKAQVLESKSDFLKQAKEEILRLGSQNKWVCSVFYS